MPTLIAIAAKTAMVGAVATSPAPAHAHTVVVKPGDTLSAIAATHNVPGGWETLYAANEKVIGQDPDLIYPGKRFTIPAHKLAATAAFIDPNHYTVKANDNLSALAAKFKTPGGWDSIFAANPSLSNPNALEVGMTLTLPHHAMFRHWSAPVVAPAPVASSNVSTGSAGSTAVTSNVTSTSGGSFLGNDAMQRCIIQRESGGNPNVTNASGHYGLYQFSYSTWVGSGGNPSSFGHASVAEQNQVFANAVAARGYSDWTPYDGC